MREPTKVEQAAAAALTVVYAGYVAWLMVPEHTRRLWAMKALRRLESTSGRLAAAAGQAAMHRELVGEAPGYPLPAMLSRVRDAAARWYGRVRSR